MQERDSSERLDKTHKSVYSRLRVRVPAFLRPDKPTSRTLIRLKNRARSWDWASEICLGVRFLPVFRRAPRHECRGQSAPGSCCVYPALVPRGGRVACNHLSAACLLARTAGSAVMPRVWCEVRPIRPQCCSWHPIHTSQRAADAVCRSYAVQESMPGPSKTRCSAQRSLQRCIQQQRPNLSPCA